MSDTTFSSLDTRLEQFERRLQTHLDTLHKRRTLTIEHQQKIAELDEKARKLKSKLHEKLRASHGVDWELLRLELQNDLLLLTNSFRNWTHRQDNRFDRYG